MIKACLIDVDGFLVNSEELYLEANKMYFKTIGFEFTEELHRQGTGKKFVQWIKTILPSSDKSGEKIFRERNVIFYELAKKRLNLLPGVYEFLELVKGNFKTSIVTSSPKDYLELVFELTGIQKFFDVVITEEMVIKGKPDPECYLLAATELSVKPDECVVFEDAPNGVLAGKNAGMKVIAVPSYYVKGDLAFQKADIVFESVKEITFDKILS